MKVRRRRRCRSFTTGVYHERVTRLGVTTSRGRPDCLGRPMHDTGDRIEIARKDDAWPQDAARGGEADQMIDVDHVNAQRSDPRQQVRNVSADVQPHIRAHVVQRRHQLLFKWQYQ